MGSLHGDGDTPGRYRQNGYLHRGTVGGHHHQNQNNHSPRRDVVDPTSTFPPPPPQQQQLTNSVGVKPGVVAALTHRFNVHHQPPPLFLQTTAAASRRRRSSSPPLVEVRNSTTQRPSVGGGHSRDFLPVVVNGAGQRVSQQHEHRYQPHHVEYAPAHGQLMAAQQQQLLLQQQRRSNGGSWISVPTDRQQHRGHQRENTTPRLKYSHNYVTDDVINNGGRHYAVDNRLSPRSSSTSGLETASGSILKKRLDGPQWDDSVAIRALGKPLPHDVIVTSSRSRHGHSSNNNNYNYNNYKSGSKTSRSRRVLFKNNVAVYRFDSDGADSSAYSSTSESSELLNDGTRHQRDVTRPGRGLTTMMVGPEGRSLSSTVDVVADPGYYYPVGGRPHLTQQQRHQQQHGEAAGGHLAVGGHYRAEPDRLLEGVVTTCKILPSPRDAGVVSEAERGRSTQQTHRRTPVSLRNVHSVSPSPRTEHQPAGRESRDAAGPHPAPQQQQQPPALQTQTSLSLEDCLVGPHSSSIVRVRYVQVNDGQESRLILTCNLQPHRLFDPDNIVVKANRAGTRVRIVFATDENGEGPTDQLMLPETVDPYQLSARLESNCTLIIEAPIVR